MKGQLSAEAKVFLKAYKGEYAHRGGRHADRLVESMAAFDATDYFEGPLVGLSEWQQDEVAGVSYCYIIGLLTWDEWEQRVYDVVGCDAAEFAGFEHCYMETLRQARQEYS